jgi:hypothetical protein
MVPPGLVRSTVRAAALSATGPATPVAISETVAALTEGVLKAMSMSKRKILAFGMLALAAAAAGGALSRSRAVEPVADAGSPPRAAPPAGDGVAGVRFDKEVQRFLEAPGWVLTKVDPKRSTISVRYQNRMQLDDLPVDPKAKIHVNGKAGSFKDLKAGMSAEIGNLAPNGPRVTWIDARADDDQCESLQLEAVDVKARTIRVRKTAGGTSATLGVAEDAKITFRAAGEGKGKGPVDKTLADLKPRDGGLGKGMRISLHLGLEGGGIVVKRIEVEVPEGD